MRAGCICTFPTKINDSCPPLYPPHLPQPTPKPKLPPVTTSIQHMTVPFQTASSQTYCPFLPSLCGLSVRSVPHPPTALSCLPQSGKPLPSRANSVRKDSVRTRSKEKTRKEKHAGEQTNHALSSFDDAFFFSRFYFVAVVT